MQESNVKLADCNLKFTQSIENRNVAYLNSSQYSKFLFSLKSLTENLKSRIFDMVNGNQANLAKIFSFIGLE